jgi:hypothetical protein
LYNYLGNTSDGISVDSTDFIQPRASALADESLVTNPALFTKRGADLAQATNAKQPLFYDGFRTVNGLPVIYQEDGRAAYLQTTDASVCAVAAGDNPPLVVIGVAKADTNLHDPLRFEYDGSNYLDVRVYNADVQVRRVVGGSSTTVTITGAGTLLQAGVSTFALLIDASRGVKFYVGGSLIDSGTFTDVGSMPTPALVRTMTDQTNRAGVVAELALFAGELTYDGQLREIAKAIGRRWGGLPA